MFLLALGLGQADDDVLRAALLEAAREADAVPGEVDQYGARYTVDFPDRPWRSRRHSPQRLDRYPG